MNTHTYPLRKRAPADLKKDANGFDLSIALGLLLASGQVAFDRPGNFAIVGELALTGETRPVKGILSMAIQSVTEGRDGLLVPTANAAEAAVVEGLNVYPIGSLAEAVGFLTGQVDMDPESVDLDELFAVIGVSSFFDEKRTDTNNPPIIPTGAELEPTGAAPERLTAASRLCEPDRLSRLRQPPPATPGCQPDRPRSVRSVVTEVQRQHELPIPRPGLTSLPLRAGTGL